MRFSTLKKMLPIGLLLAALLVILQAARGIAGGQDEQIFAPIVHGPGEFSLSLDPFASGLASPVDIANAGDERLFVVEQAGRIRVLEPDGTVLPAPFLDIRARVLSGGERGLLGLAFHPDYQTNGYFYVNYTRDAAAPANDGDTVIARFSVSADPDVADPNSEQILMVIPQPDTNHNGGDLNFGPDGYLYIGLGDGGGGGDPGDFAQDPAELLGKMLRIDVDGGGHSPDCASGPYTVPADNPLVGTAGACDEIWASGLRNPWRFSFDRQTGDMFIGDVGQASWEEIDFQPAASTGGENWGWDCFEGDHSFADPSPRIGCGPAGDYDFPIFEYESNGGPCAVTGGFVYRGGLYPAMVGHYIFADYCSGDFWSLSNPGGSGWVSLYQGDFGSSFTTFGEGADGELYAASGGTIYHVIAESTALTPTPTNTLTATPANTLTATATSTLTATPPPTATVLPVEPAIYLPLIPG